ncbi:hypothetical protein Lepto7375DRAFT_8233 [Leptolyngbya sp. PCC 7375]|nr:hypothetical protein Lepto7375DRAFT_8233 [Leptolyngbya sp. PCC 7375]
MTDAMTNQKSPKLIIKQVAAPSVPEESDAVIAGNSSDNAPEITVAVTSSDVASESPLAQEQFEELDPLLPMAELVHTLTDYEKQRVNPETGQVLTVEEIKVDMPIELRVTVDDAGQVTLKGAAPTQRTATTVLPMFHRMQLRIVEDRREEHHG